MDPVDLAIILLHPIAAIFVIGWMLRQHRWRQRGRILKGDERKDAVHSHEKQGHRIYIMAWILVIGGFAANATHRIRTEGVDLPQALLPTGAGGLHAGGGVLGLILLTYLWQRGRNVKRLRESGESWSTEKNRHGRASDAIMLLIVIHAFLGFLWLLQMLI